MAALGAMLLSVGCTPHKTPPRDDRLFVFVGVAPLAYLVEQIGGEYVSVGVLVQPGQDPHTFDPTPQQILALSKSKLFFQVGMPFESLLLEKIKEGNDRLTVIDATQGIQKHPASACSHDSEHGDLADGSEETSHGELDSSNGEHAASDHSAECSEGMHAGALDPHVWLSPLMLKQMARNMATAMQQADSTHSEIYAKNLDTLLERIDSLHERIGRMLAPYRGQAFYVFHPGFGYFADAFGLTQIAVEADGKSPTPKQMQALIQQAREDQVQVIFVQPQSPRRSAEVIAEAIGARVVTINGLSKDVLSDLDDIATKVDVALKGQRTK